MNRFYVGQKVVCVPIYGQWKMFEKTHPECHHPVKDGIYTIRNIYKDLQNSDVIGVHLKEINNPKFQCGEKWYEIGFRAEEFRPLEEKKTDISIFKKLLNPSKVHENT